MHCAAGTLFLCLTGDAGRINHSWSALLLQLLYLEWTNSLGWAPKGVNMGIVTCPYRGSFSKLEVGEVMCSLRVFVLSCVPATLLLSLLFLWIDFSTSCVKTKNAHLRVKINCILLSCVALFCFQPDALGGYCFRRILTTGISPPLDSQQTGIRIRYLAEAVLLTDRSDLAVTSVLISLALLEFDTLEHEILAPLWH